jgi:hypothetical protein
MLTEVIGLIFSFTIGFIYPIVLFTYYGIINLGV